MSEKAKVLEMFNGGILANIVRADDIFLVDGGIKPVYEAVIEKLHADVVGLDPKTKKGQKEIRSVAQNGRKNKTFIDKIGGQVKKKYLAPAENIDPNRREAKHNIDKAIEEILAPVIAEEQKLENRRIALEQAFSSFEALSVKEDVDGSLFTADELQTNMSALNNTTFAILSERLDIDGEELKVNFTKISCAKRLQGFIDERVKYESDQAELEVMRVEKELANMFSDEINSLKLLAKVDDGLTSLGYAAIIHTMNQQVIDDRYGNRKEEASDIKELCLMKLEKAASTAKAKEDDIKKPNVIDNSAIDNELKRWKDLASDYMRGDAVSIQRGIDGLYAKTVDSILFGERTEEAKNTKDIIILEMQAKLDGINLPIVSEESDESDQDSCDSNVNIEIASIISEILGCELSSSILVVDSMVDGKLSDLVTIN